MRPWLVLLACHSLQVQVCDLGVCMFVTDAGWGSHFGCRVVNALQVLLLSVAVYTAILALALLGISTQSWHPADGAIEGSSRL